MNEVSQLKFFRIAQKMMGIALFLFSLTGVITIVYSFLFADFTIITIYVQTGAIELNLLSVICYIGFRIILRQIQEA